MGDLAAASVRPVRSLAAVACLGVYLAYFDRAMPAAAAPLLKRALGVSDARLGFAIATAAALGYAAVAIGLAAVGPWLRRHGRGVMIAGIVGWTGGAVVLAFARTFAGYVGGECLIGASQALFVPAAATLIAHDRGGPALGRSTARFTVASSLGRTSATLIAGAIIAVVIATGAMLPGLPQPWRAVFVIAALPNLAVIVALALNRKVDAPQPAAAREAMAVVEWLALGGALLVATAPVMLIQAVGGWYPMLLVRLAGATPADAAMAAGGTMLIAAPLGQWLGGVLLDRRPGWRARPTGVIVTTLATTAVVLAVLARAPGLAIELAALATVDLLLGIAALTGLATIQARVRATERHRVNSLFFGLVTIVGVGLAPLLAGWMSDLGGANGAALAVALAGIAVGAIAVALAGHLLGRAAMRYAAVPTG